MRKPTSQKQGMSHLHPVLSSHWVAREVAWYVHPYVTAPNYEGDYVSSRPQEFCGKMEKRGKYFRFGATGRVLPVSDFQQIGWDPWRCLCLWCMAEVFPVGSRMGMGSGLTMWKEKKETFSGKENILKKKKKRHQGMQTSSPQCYSLLQERSEHFGFIPFTADFLSLNYSVLQWANSAFKNSYQHNEMNVIHFLLF